MTEVETLYGDTLELTVPDELRENGLPYVSKSRIKKYLECPLKFLICYWMDNRSPGSYHTEKGSLIHEGYEQFHLNLIDYVLQNRERPEWYTDVMPSDWTTYGQWLEPHWRNFWEFEDERWELATDYAAKMFRSKENPGEGKTVMDYAFEAWLPLGVEVEGWLGEPPESYERADPDWIHDEIPAGDVPWMGKADAILHAATVPGVEAEEGVVILDYKTGKVPDKKYRSKGIYLEGEYYGWLFEQKYDVVAVAGYYPQEDELLISPYPDEERREIIVEAVEGMQEKPTFGNYEKNEGPLCHYGHGRCYYYDACPTTWGQPGGTGWHNKAGTDGSITPKDE